MKEGWGEEATIRISIIDLMPVANCESSLLPPYYLLSSCHSEWSVA